MDKFTETEKELMSLLKKVITNEDSFVGTMLALTVKQSDPEGNCKQMIDFLKNNPQATYDETMIKINEILGIEDPFADDDESND